jgi:PTS system nitrogen regulatory IIA component
MKITDILRPSAVIELSSSSAQDALMELCGPVVTSSLDAQFLLEKLLLRESQGSTCVGNGVAIPHARIADLPTVTASFGRSRRGVDFGDGTAQPTHLFFALFAPATPTPPYLRTLARICQLFNAARFRDSVMRARDSVAIYRLIEAMDSIN